MSVVWPTEETTVEFGGIQACLQARDTGDRAVGPHHPARHCWCGFQCRHATQEVDQLVLVSQKSL